MNKGDLIYLSGFYKIFRPFYSGMGHALLFHRVGIDDDNIFTKNLRVSPEFLERTIKYFRFKGY